MTRSRGSKTGVYAPGEDYFVLNSSMISDDSSVEVISLTYYSTHIVNHRKYFARNISGNLSIAAESNALVRPNPDKPDNLRPNGDYDETAICSRFH